VRKEVNRRGTRGQSSIGNKNVQEGRGKSSTILGGEIRGRRETATPKGTEALRRATASSLNMERKKEERDRRAGGEQEKSKLIRRRL